MVVDDHGVTWRRWSKLAIEAKEKLVKEIEKAEIPVNARDPLVLFCRDDAPLADMVSSELIAHLDEVHDGRLVVADYVDGVTVIMWYWEVGSTL